MEKINNKNGIIIFILTLIVVGIGISYAYYSALVQGTGNVNAEASGKTATIGEVEFNGETTFDSSTLDEIYPGFIGIQEFTISPYKDGTGIYEVDLQATVPSQFGSDIRITIYKTSDKTNNNITRTEGTLTITDNQYTKQDILNITGSLLKVYEDTLTSTSETMLEQTYFSISNNAFTTPIVTPDGYYTYYVIYEYLDNGNQNNQQGLDFDSKITVKYITDIPNLAGDTLASLQALNPSLTLTESNNINPSFTSKSPPTPPGTDYGTGWGDLANGVDTYITYASDFSYDTNTGIYTLVDYTVCQYSTCYNDLVGKYMIINDDYEYGSATNEAVIQSFPSMENEVDQVTSADSEGTIGAIVYHNGELNDTEEKKWEEQDSGLYELPDDYGPSYYFRGDIDYNYVKFGKYQTDHYIGYNKSSRNDYGAFTTLASCETKAGSGNCLKYGGAGDDIYWRIIRINGDGSIRMIYDGTSANGKNDMGYDGYNDSTIYRNIGWSATNSKYNDNTYVGYMYGTAGADNYNDAHANTNSSTIKTKIDAWYANQLIPYSEYISDTIFCYDRSVASDEVISWKNTNPSGGEYTRKAYGTNNTIYSPYGRIIEQVYLNKGNRAILSCPQKNDRFTVSDTAHGNGALTYPIGLITSDEANVAGAVYDQSNSDLYLSSSGQGFHTMTPGSFHDGFAYDFALVGTASCLLDGHVGLASHVGVRPVINLKPGSINAGDGTAANPFRIE